MKIKWGSLPFLEKEKQMIAVVGAGGKTTLIYWLAETFAKKGKKVVVTTTTHMRMPEPDLFVDTLEDLKKRWNGHQFGVIGEKAEEGKIKGLSPEIQNQFFQACDVILVEADGAKGMPCKIPADHEPVIPKEADIVIGVMGLDAMGKKIKEGCFRHKIGAQVFQFDPEEELTKTHMAQILSSPLGTKKAVNGRNYYVVINKCNTLEEVEKGKSILKELEKNGIKTGVLVGR